MKKKLYIKTAFLSLAAMATLSSCLKDNAHYVDFADTKPLVELPAATGIVSGGGLFETVSFPISSTPAVLNTLVNIAAPQPLSSAVTVKLSVDAAALDAYNTANSTSYTLLPAADYTTTGTVTIPAKTYQANFVINLNTSLIDPSASYVLPITITDGGGQQISNYKTILYNVGVKNAFDVNYTATGYVFHPSSPRAISATYELNTVGAIRNQAPFADLGASGYLFDFDVVPKSGTVYNLTNYSAVGSAPAVPASGFMTLDNPSGTVYAASPGGLPGGATYNSTIFNNTYDSSTKTFLMHFGYGGGSTGQGGYTRQFYMKLVAQ